jgi:hypothetical protein
MMRHRIAIALIPMCGGGGSLASIAGKPVCLRFVMKDADLFAMRFASAN